MILYEEILVQFSSFVLETNITFLSSGYDSALHIAQHEGVLFFPFPLTSISMSK